MIGIVRRRRRAQPETLRALSRRLDRVVRTTSAAIEELVDLLEAERTRRDNELAEIRDGIVEVDTRVSELYGRYDERARLRPIPSGPSS